MPNNTKAAAWKTYIYINEKYGHPKKRREKETEKRKISRGEIMQEQGKEEAV